MQTKNCGQYKIADKEFEQLKTLIKELTGINLTEQKKMLIVAQDVSGEALHALVINGLHGKFVAPAVRAPYTHAEAADNPKT
ncbi:MAG: hypothetical protein QME41_10480, partial [Actinomycetota bacterium]|nr:hypothetical protein [Actinomycetota bacterium]